MNFSKNNEDIKVIGVMPAGRKKHLEIIIPYLLKNRQHFNEFHFWLNTQNREDIEYIGQITRLYPDFFKIVRKKPVSDIVWRNIWQYFREYIDSNTIYIRLDDDICYIAEDAIPNLIRCRKENPHPFLISGNVINNSYCSFLQQKKNILPLAVGKITKKIQRLTSSNGFFAEKVHNLFLSDVTKKKINRWKMKNITLDANRGFQVNAIAWFGKDMAQVKEIYINDLKDSYEMIRGKKVNILWEERMISRVLPLRYNRPSMVCGNAVFAHFAFTNQQYHLYNNTNLLERYAHLVDKIPITPFIKPKNPITTKICNMLKSIARVK